MDLINHTPFPAFLWTAIADDERLMASLVTRVTFDIRGSRLTPSAEHVWQVSPAPWESPYGAMEADDCFYKGGVDLFVFGHARPPGGGEAKQLEVSIELGEFRRRILVFGDRVWERHGAHVEPSPPKPFRALPLTVEHAFGGKAPWDGLEVPFADNVVGKGFYLEEEQAVDQPLPNLEDPEHLIRKWDDRPDPVGVRPCPMANGKRLRLGVEFDENGALKKIRPRLFNAAYPEMVAARVQPGDRCRLVGMTDGGPITFWIPDFAPRVRLAFDDEVIERPLAIDQVGIEPDERRVFITYRYPFVYVLYPLQRRSAELLPP
jgi:hypothetical protein